MENALAGVSSMDDTLNIAPIRDLPSQPQLHLRHALLQLVLDGRVAHGEPVGHRLLALAQAGVEPPRGDGAERSGHLGFDVAVQLEALRRVAHLGLVRGQVTALVIAIGQARTIAILSIDMGFALEQTERRIAGASRATDPPQVGGR